MSKIYLYDLSGIRESNPDYTFCLHYLIAIEESFNAPQIVPNHFSELGERDLRLVPKPCQEVVRASEICLCLVLAKPDLLYLLNFSCFLCCHSYMYILIYFRVRWEYRSFHKHTPVIPNSRMSYGIRQIISRSESQGSPYGLFRYSESHGQFLNRPFFWKNFISVQCSSHFLPIFVNHSFVFRCERFSFIVTMQIWWIFSDIQNYIPRIFGSLT